MVYLKTYGSPPINKKEILRYAGVSEETPEIGQLLSECVEISQNSLSYKVCYSEFTVSHHSGYTDLGFFTTNSAALAKNLAGCQRVIVFAATVGIGIDRLIMRHSSMSPAKALMIQAIGAERIEALCDTFCHDIKNELGDSFVLRPRFSPGYGDLPLTVQKEIFSVLDAPRKIGLTLNDSLLMSPTKSVTAIVGIAENKTK